MILDLSKSELCVLAKALEGHKDCLETLIRPRVGLPEADRYNKELFSTKSIIDKIEQLRGKSSSR